MGAIIFIIFAIVVSLSFLENSLSGMPIGSSPLSSFLLQVCVKWVSIPIR